MLEKQCLEKEMVLTDQVQNLAFPACQQTDKFHLPLQYIPYAGRL